MPRIKQYWDESRLATRLKNRHETLPQVLSKLFKLLLHTGQPVIGLECTDACCIVAAENAGAKWLAGSPSHRHAAKIRNQILKSSGIKSRIRVEQSETTDSALRLAATDPEEFLYWVLDSTEATFSENIRSRNALFDGHLWFDSSQPVPLIVKATEPSGADLRNAASILRDSNVGDAVLVMPSSPSNLAIPKCLHVITVKDLVNGDWYTKVPRTRRSLRAALTSSQPSRAVRKKTAAL